MPGLRLAPVDKTLRQFFAAVLLHKVAAVNAVVRLVFRARYEFSHRLVGLAEYGVGFTKDGEEWFFERG